MKLCYLLIAFLPLVALAQNPQEKANLLKNGNFEQFTDEENLWDGVDSQGFLAGDASEDQLAWAKDQAHPRGPFLRKGNGQYDAVLDGGNVGRLSMPISVQIADLNKDGLLDILTTDAHGYTRVYFNKGTPTEPKFGQGEIVPLFLHRLCWYGALKTCLGDFDKSGSTDLVMGSYYGQVFMIRNSGSPVAPEWKQPQDLASITVPTAAGNNLWGNLFAPAVYDWNGDGKPDLLVGEGGYSANAVHLLLNVGTLSAPKFNEDNRDYLAYGDGREQLIPAVVDYNGDGLPDLLVGDRTGTINVYLSEGPWKRGAELKRMEKPIMFGNVPYAARQRCVFPAVADLNGDGKFDIIVGETSGRIAVSYNIGTDKEPKFGPLVELKGEDLFKMGSIREPRDWAPEFGYWQGNFNGIYTVVTPQEDPEAAPSTHAIKFCYAPNTNKIIKKPATLLTGTTTSPKGVMIEASFRNNVPYYWGEMVRRGGHEYDSNTAILRQTIEKGVLTPGTSYNLSFKVKGRGVTKGKAMFGLGGWLIRDVTKLSTVIVPGNLISEGVQQEIAFNVTTSWSVVTKTFNLKFDKETDLNNPGKWTQPNNKLEYRGLVEIRAPLNIDDGAFYIEDVRLTPQ